MPTPPRRRRTDRTLLVVLLAVGGAVALGCAGVAAFVVARAAARPAVVDRQAFRDLVVGKTPDEVLAAVGAPDSTQEQDATGARYWYYRGRTRDPITGKVDGRAQVVFGRSGVVERVNY